MSSARQKLVRSIQQLEILANKQPNRYRLRVFLAIALGYVYLLVAIAIFCVYLYNCQQLFSYRAPILSLINFVCLTLLVISAFNSIFVKFPPPAGIGFDLEDPAHAEFKKIINSLADRYKCRPIDFVIISEDFNLEIVHVPQFGMLAKNCNFLVLGLPLMLALSSSQFQAILAREISHLSTNELRLEGWIYRLSKSYHYLLSRLEAIKKLDLVFIQFWRWYVPILDLHCFGVRRKYEYEIDKLVAKNYGTKTLAEALVSIEIYRQFLGQEFWAEIRDSQKLCPQPPADIYDRLERSIVDNFDRDKIDRWLELALNKLTGDLDTRPCLKDRLIALGYVDRTIETLAPSAHLEQNAARKYLGILPNLSADLSLNWQQARSVQWYQNFLELYKAQKSLERLTLKAENSQLARAQSSLDRITEKSMQQDLSIDEFWLLAKRKIQLGDLDGGIIVLYQVLEINPHHARTNLWLGSILLEMGNFNGLDYLETAMNIDPGTICGATATIRRFAKIIPDPEDALLCESIANRHYLNWINNSHKYVKRIKPLDLHKKHQISEDKIRNIVDRVLEISEIQHVYATLKSRKEDLLEQHYIFATYSLQEIAATDNEDFQNTYIALEMALESIGLCTIFLFAQNGYYECNPVIDKLRSIPKTCIYNRKKILAANNEDDNDIDRTYDIWR